MTGSELSHARRVRKGRGSRPRDGREGSPRRLALLEKRKRLPRCIENLWIECFISALWLTRMLVLRRWISLESRYCFVVSGTAFCVQKLRKRSGREESREVRCVCALLVGDGRRGGCSGSARRRGVVCGLWEGGSGRKMMLSGVDEDAEARADGC